MKRFKRIMVPLGLSAGDLGPIAWAGIVTRLAQSREVTFLHALEAPEIPETARKRYPWLTEPLDSMVLEKMKEQVRSIWDGYEGAELRFQVSANGSMVMSILEAILQQGTDLVIVGHETCGRDTSIRLARKAPCSVMSVPAETEVRLKRILVPTDFSNFSRSAADVALAFAEAEGLEGIETLHVYDIGKFAHRVTLPESEMKAMVEEFVQERHQEFVDSLDLRGLKITQHNVFHPSASVSILRMVREEGMDLIVTGCRGRDTLTSWLLGGNAEAVLENSKVPVIAAKEKGTGQKLLEALLHE